MGDEILDIFTIDMKHIGTATRSEVHKKGYWHQTFHCWFLEKESQSILFQRRHKNKKDYPYALDITVAGHLSAGENPHDGVREIQEEVGIDVQVEELIFTGIYQGSIIMPDLIDNEFCHLFFYINEHPIDRFILQTDEVASIIRIQLAQLNVLMNHEVTELIVEEHHISNGRSSIQLSRVTLNDFVSHEERYYKHIIRTANDIFLADNKM